MPIMVNVLEAKTRLSELLKYMEGGQEVIIARAGKPIARLQPYSERGPRFGKILPGLPAVPDSVWFDPLPEEELAAWEGTLDEDEL